MYQWFLVWIALMITTVFAVSGHRAFAEVELSSEWHNELPSHPRLLWTAEEQAKVRTRLDSDAAIKRTWEKVKDAADRMLLLEPTGREMEGRRMLKVSRKYLKRVLYLGTAWRLTGEERYLHQAEREMLAAAAFDDWNPRHFLDVAEMTAALAIGYDWLHDELDETTRATVREAIVDKGLRTSFEPDFERRFVNRTNNWNQVCNAGLVLGALAVAEHEPELAGRVISRAAAIVPKAMAVYDPDGTFPEGPSYWRYGTTFNVILIAALETALDNDFGLAAQPGFMLTADYWLHVAGPTGTTFNYGDGDPAQEPAVAQAWLARRRGEPHLMYHEPGRVAALDQIDAAGHFHRLLPLMLAWATELESGSLPTPTRHSFLGQGVNPVAMHRTGWDEQAVFVGFKAGTPDVSHGHLDVGHFVLEAHGLRWSVDLGKQDYGDLEAQPIGNIWRRNQESTRWKILRYNNYSHSTLTVDDQLQRAAGFAPITRHQAMDEDEPNQGHTVADMVALYEGQLAEARRGVKLHADDRVLIQDEVRALPEKDGPTTVRWAMATPGELVARESGQAMLAAADQYLHLRVVGLAEAPRITTWPLTPANAWDAENPGVRLVGFEVQLEPGQSMQWGVELVPMNEAGEPAFKIDALRPLEAWSPALD